MKLEIDQPHGFMQDSAGRTCIRFANWNVDQVHEVPDFVETVHYVSGPAAFNRPNQVVHKSYKGEQ